MDLARQFASPYNGMGNNPVNGVDPDGAWVFGAFDSTSAQRQEIRSAKRLGAETSGWFSGNVNITHTLNEEVTLTNNRPNWLITYRFSYQVDRKGNAFGHIAWEVLTNIGGNANGLNSLFNDSLWAVPWGKVAGLAWKGTGWATQRLLFGGTNRVLWSRGGIAVAGAEATAYAVANGAITLEMTVARRALTTLTNVTSQRFMQPFWRMASKSFASGARGMTPVFIAPRLLTPPSLYLRTERAMLQVNQTQYQFFFIF